MSAEPEWTPGPWVSEDRPPNMKIIFAEVASGNRPSPCLMMDGNQRANADLIAAAPDLYASLHALMDDSRFVVSVGGNPIVVDAMLNDARTALAKARGET